MSLILILVALAVLVVAGVALARHRGLAGRGTRSGRVGRRRPHPDDRHRSPDQA